MTSIFDSVRTALKIGGQSKPEDTDNRLSDPEFREKLREKAEQLEKEYSKEKVVTDKMLQLKELSHMRKVYDKERSNTNLTYPVNPPFAFVNIKFDKEEGELQYILKEPKITPEEREVLEKIKIKMENFMDKEEIPLGEGRVLTKSQELRTYLKGLYNEVIDIFDIELEDKRKLVLFYYLEKELLGWGRSDGIIKDPYIEDISCNGPKIPMYIFHRVFGSMKTNVVYQNDAELNKYVIKLAQIAGKHVSVYQPILDATLSDGSRINLTLGSEVTRKGSTYTIRKFSHDPISPVDLLRFKSIDPLQLAYFWFVIEHHRSMMISGGTASGKTTLLNALCMFIKPEDKIVSIEDTPEIHIDHVNWIQSVARAGFGAVSGISASGVSGPSGGAARPGSISLFDLLVAALRQRPEYVIVGEVRGKEAFTLFQAISVGHAGMSTVHAGSIDELLHRVENEPMSIPRVMFQSLDFVAFQGQVFVHGKRARRVKAIVEVLDIERDTKNLLTNEVFRWDPKADKFNFSGRSFLLEKIGKQIGKDIDVILEDIHQRENYLRLLDSKNVTHYKDVSRAINAYYLDPVSATLELDKR